MLLLLYVINIFYFIYLFKNYIIYLIIVPEPPAGLKSILLPSNMALVTWIPPKHPNGRILHYTLYEREVNNGIKLF